MPEFPNSIRGVGGRGGEASPLPAGEWEIGDGRDFFIGF